MMYDVKLHASSGFLEIS